MGIRWMGIIMWVVESGLCNGLNHSYLMVIVSRDLMVMIIQWRIMNSG